MLPLSILVKIYLMVFVINVSTGDENNSQRPFLLKINLFDIIFLSAHLINKYRRINNKLICHTAMHSRVHNYGPEVSIYKSSNYKRDVLCTNSLVFELPGVQEVRLKSPRLFVHKFQH